jgi:hypothetical protein
MAPETEFASDFRYDELTDTFSLEPRAVFDFCMALCEESTQVPAL